jgi:hypothetical protein
MWSPHANLGEGLALLNRIEEITEFCDESTNDLFYKLKEIISVIKTQLLVDESKLRREFERYRSDNNHNSKIIPSPIHPQR